MPYPKMLLPILVLFASMSVQTSASEGLCDHVSRDMKFRYFMDGRWVVGNGRPFMVGEVARKYAFYVPEKFYPESPAPLVLDLPTDGQDMESQEATSLISRESLPLGMVTVSLQAASGKWGLDSDWTNSSAEVDYVNAVIKDVSKRLCIDKHSIFMTGFGSGASVTSMLGCHMPAHRSLAGIAAVAGVQMPEPCPRGAPLPVLAVHGTQDLVQPFEGTGVAGDQGVLDSVCRWAVHNKCKSAVQVEAVEGADLVTLQVSFPACEAPVRLLVARGLGHSYPGGEGGPGSGEQGPRLRGLSAAAHAVQFFRDVAYVAGNDYVREYGDCDVKHPKLSTRINTTADSEEDLLTVAQCKALIEASAEGFPTNPPTVAPTAATAPTSAPTPSPTSAPTKPKEGVFCRPCHCPPTAAPTEATPTLAPAISTVTPTPAEAVESTNVDDASGVDSKDILGTPVIRILRVSAWILCTMFVVMRGECFTFSTQRAQ